MVAVPSPIYPEAARFLNIAREVGGFGVVPATGFVSIPVATFEPVPKVNPIPDMALRGAMAEPYDFQMGASWTEHSIGESPIYGDTIGHILANMFGDWTDIGTASTPTGTLSAGIAPGVIALPVASGGASFTTGMTVQIGTTTTAEIVTVGAGSTSTSIVVSPTRFAHLTAAPIVNVTPPITHTFATLNPASSTGLVSGQPATHTVLDRNQVAGSAGFYTDQFPYMCFSEIEIMGKPLGYLSWSGKATSQPQGTVSSAAVANFSTVRGIPAWKGTSTVAGSAVSDVASWTITMSREVTPIPTIDGSQAVYVISRGPLKGTFALEYSPALDETALNLLLNNTQPTLVWSTSNGLTGANLVSFTVNAQMGAVTEAPLKVTSSLLGYSVSGTLVGNMTNVGNSGGWGVATIVLVNAVGSY